MVAYNHNYTMRKTLVLVFFACAALGQKKPVTLEALQAWRNTAAALNVPGDPVWAPDGKTFVYRQGTQLKLYEIAAKKSRCGGSRLRFRI